MFSDLVGPNLQATICDPNLSPAEFDHISSMM